MTRRLTLFSPAKVNLFLAVGARRADGFHDLVSLVAPIDFGDRIELTVEPGGSATTLTCDDPAVPTGAANLAVQAAELFREATGNASAIAIKLFKRIPMGAGLGGGSSNAATVLRGLNELSDSPLSDAALGSLAARIGSDCPLFLAGGPCIIRGRGDAVEALEEAHRARLRGTPILLFKPAFPISTKWAYERLAESRREAPAAFETSRRLDEWLRGRAAIETLLYNSFEHVVFRKFIALPTMLDRLQRGSTSRGGLLSGSGSACFVLLHETAASAGLQELVRDGLGESAFCREARIT